MGMTKDEIKRIVCSLLRLSLQKRYDDSVLSLPEELRQVSDWRVILEELKVQTVFGLVQPILGDLEIQDPSIIKEWSALCKKQQIYWVKLAYTQKELSALLDKNGIPFVVMKGMSAAYYYPHPLFRSSGDIDILVKRDDFNRAAELLQKNNYQLKLDITDVSHHNEYTN